MDKIKKWNYIVDRYNALYNLPESIIQKEWEGYFSELLDYKKIFGEIESQRNITIGSHQRVIPDIILRANDNDLVDVELKQYNLPFSIKMEEQLKSYLKLLNLSVGVIICQKLYLCYFDYSSDKIDKVAIDFVKDNKNGIAFVEMLNKINFNENIIKDFIRKQLESKINIVKIQNEINDELLYLLLNDYLSQQYSEEEIKEALKNYKISISKDSSTNATSNTIPTTGEEIEPIDDGDFPTTPNYIIIKTSYDRVNSCNGNLYDATRHCWRVKFDTANRYKYVLAVIGGIVKEVYEVKYWQDAERWPNDGNVDGRLEFIGQVATGDVRNLFIGKTIPAKYRKPGMASPVIYSK